MVKRPIYDPFTPFSSHYQYRLRWVYTYRFSEDVRKRPLPPDLQGAGEIAALARASNVAWLRKGISYAIDDELWWHRENRKLPMQSDNPGPRWRTKAELKRVRRLSLDLYACVQSLDEVTLTLIDGLAVQKPKIWEDELGASDLSDNDEVYFSNFIPTVKRALKALADASLRAFARLN